MATYIELGGKQRELRFTLRALRHLEKESGLKFASDRDDARKFTAWMSSIEGISTLLYAGLMRDGEITQDWILDNMDVQDLLRVGKELAPAFWGDVNPPDDPDAPKNGTAESQMETTTAMDSPQEPLTIGS